MKSCLGRLTVNIPEGFVPTGRSSSMWHVDLATLDLDGRTPDDLWEDRIGRLESDVAPAAGEDEALDTLRIEPGMQAVVYVSDPSDPDLITVEAQKPYGTHVLRLRFEGLAEKRADILRLLGNAAGSYEPGSTEGFCIGHGSVVGKPSVNEFALMTLEHPEAGIELSIQSQTAGPHLSEHPLADIENEIRTMRSEGVFLEVLKDARRQIGRWDGYEGWVRMEAVTEEPALRTTWFYPGISADSRNPEIQIKAFAPVESRELHEAAWEAVLNSMGS